MGDDLHVGRLVEGFRPRQLLPLSRITKPDMLDQLVLGLAGTANQDFARVGQGFGDPMVVMLIFLGMAVGDAAMVVIQVNMGLVGQDVQLLDFTAVEVEDPGFVVVGP
jgi:hypothetical protein